MQTRAGVKHFDSGGMDRRSAQAAERAKADKAIADKAALDKIGTDLVAKYKGKVPLAAAIAAAADYKKTAEGQMNQGRGYGRDAPPARTLADIDAAQTIFKVAGLDPALLPKNVDLGFYNKLQTLAGGRLDPQKTLAAATYYEDGRSKAREDRIPELVATGLAQGKSGKELWKPVEEWNDSQRGKNEGWGGVENFATGMASSIASNPVAGAFISAAASAAGVPPMLVSSLLAANKVGQGQDINQVIKGMALDYVGGKAGEFAKGAAGTALQGSGLGSTATNALTNVASQGARQLATTGKLDAAGLARGAVTGAARDYAGDAISTLAKENGLDSINIAGLDIPGGFNLKDNLVPGMSAGDANKILTVAKPIIGSTAGGRKALSVINTLQRPTIGGIASLVGKTPPAAVRAPTGATPPPGVLRQRKG